MFTSAGAIFQLTMFGTCLNQRILNTFHYRINNLIGSPSVEDVADALKAWTETPNGLKDSFLDLLPQNYTLTEMWIQQLFPLRSAAYKYVIGEPGNIAVDTTTANVAGVLTRRGAGGSRRDVGSVHILMPPIVAYTNGGETTATWKNLANNLGDVMKLSVSILAGAGVLGPVLFNRGITPNYTPIDAVFPQDTTRVMRRRTVRVGI